MITRPLLAETLTDLDDLSFQTPYLLSYKLDGIRALKVNGKLLSRKFKPIPNRYIRRILGNLLPDGIDGEIICPNKTFNETQSLVMSEAGEPEFVFYAFDYVESDLTRPFNLRIEDLKALSLSSDFVQVLEQFEVKSKEEILQFEEKAFLDFEGVMLRKKDGPYKLGRSSKKEEILLKRKRFLDAEARVIGWEEKLKNDNIQELDAFLKTKRSKKKSGLSPSNTLGALLVRDEKTGVEFKIGSGFNDLLRQEIWENRTAFLGKLLTYTYQPSGMKEKPRFPVFKGFRSEDDL